VEITGSGQTVVVDGLYPTDDLEDDPKIRFHFISWDSDNQEIIFECTSNWHEFTVTKGKTITTSVEPDYVYAREDVKLTGMLWDNNEECYGSTWVEFSQFPGDAEYEEWSPGGEHTAEVDHETKDPWVPHPYTGRLGHKEFRADALDYAPFGSPAEYVVGGVKVQSITLTTYLGLEADLTGVTIQDPKTFIKDYLKDYAKDTIADSVPVLNQLNAIVDAGDNYAGWFGKTVLALSSIGYYVRTIKLEVAFEAVTNEGIWIEDTAIAKEEDLFIQWTSSANIGALINLYHTLIMNAADQVVQDAMGIY